MIHPNDFDVNQAWLSVRVNDTFIYVEGEPYDMYILVDVASCYIFGFIVTETTNNKGPDVEEIEQLFRKAWNTKKQFPVELYVEEIFTPKKQFKKVCKKFNIDFKVLPVNSLSLIVDEIKESFENFLDNN